MEGLCRTKGLDIWSSSIRVGAREEGSRRMRRRPEAATPPSWSIRAVLSISCEHPIWLTSWLQTHLFRLFTSCAEPESKEYRVRAGSGGGTPASCFARRFPVLLFLGMRRAREETSSVDRTAGLVDGLMSPAPQST